MLSVVVEDGVMRWLLVKLCCRIFLGLSDDGSASIPGD